MSSKDKILKELTIQSNYEGDTPNIQMLRKLLETVRSANLWRELTTVKHLRYGKLSYECHNFYYISEEIKPVLNFNLIESLKLVSK